MLPVLFEVVIRSLTINNQRVKLDIRILRRRLEIKHFGFTPLSDIMSYSSYYCDEHLVVRTFLHFAAENI